MILRVTGKVIFALIFVGAFILVVITGGGILDLERSIRAQEGAIIALTVTCWGAIYFFVLNLFFGSWRKCEVLKRHVLGFILFVPLLAGMKIAVRPMLADLPYALMVGGEIGLLLLLVYKIWPFPKGDV